MLGFKKRVGTVGPAQTVGVSADGTAPACTCGKTLASQSLSMPARTAGGAYLQACGKTLASQPLSAPDVAHGRAGCGRESPARVATPREAHCGGMPIGPLVKPAAGQSALFLPAAPLNAPVLLRDSGRIRTGAAAVPPRPAAATRATSATGAGTVRGRRDLPRAAHSSLRAGRTHGDSATSRTRTASPTGGGEP